VRARARSLPPHYCRHMAATQLNAYLASLHKQPPPHYHAAPPPAVRQRRALRLNDAYSKIFLRGLGAVAAVLVADATVVCCAAEPVADRLAVYLGSHARPPPLPATVPTTTSLLGATVRLSALVYLAIRCWGSRYSSYIPLRLLHTYLGCYPAAALTCLTVIPALVCYLVGRHVDAALTLATQAEGRTGHVLAALKKVQMTGMGRELAHPMPPVSRLEHAVLAVCGRRASLTCTDQRAALCAALNALHRHVAAATRALGDGDDGDCAACDTTDFDAATTVPSTAELQGLCDATFRRILPAYFSRVNGLFHRSRCGCLASAWTAATRLPVATSLVSGGLAAFNNQLLLLSSERQPAPAGPAAVTDHMAAAAVPYLSARRDLLQLRLRLEGCVDRLWLCEQELAAADATQLLVRGGDADTLAAAERQLCRGLARLHGIVPGSPSWLAEVADEGRCAAEAEALAAKCHASSGLATAVLGVDRHMRRALGLLVPPAVAVAGAGGGGGSGTQSEHEIAPPTPPANAPARAPAGPPEGDEGPLDPNPAVPPPPPEHEKAVDVYTAVVVATTDAPRTAPTAATVSDGAERDQHRQVRLLGELQQHLVFLEGRHPQERLQTPNADGSWHVEAGEILGDGKDDRNNNVHFVTSIQQRGILLQELATALKAVQCTDSDGDDEIS